MVKKPPSTKSIILTRKIFIIILGFFIGYTIATPDLNFYWKAAICFVTICFIFNLISNNIRDNQMQQIKDDIDRYNNPEDLK